MQLSKIISIILHPIFMPVIALYLSLKFIPSIGFAITNYLNFIYLVLLFSTIILPLMSLFFLIKKKLVSSLEMSDYKERSLPLLITAIWMIYGYYKLRDILLLSPILKSEIMGAIIIIFIASIISKYWKISLHLLGLGGVVGVLFSLNILFGGLLQIIILFVLFSGILGIARIHEKAHNHSQIYVGFLLGFLVEAGSILFF
jgi:hypothetical protein